MIIDPNKTYRTRAGLAVRIYATDGGGMRSIHGAIYDDGWYHHAWREDGQSCVMQYRTENPCDLVEVTLADELTDQIPWEMLRPEIQWVAMNAFGSWKGYEKKPEPHNGCRWTSLSRVSSLSALVLPGVDTRRWRETLCKRPEDN